MTIIENILLTGKNEGQIILSFLKKYNAEQRKIFVLCNPTTQKQCLPILEQLLQTKLSAQLIVLTIEESTKDINTCNQIWKTLLDFQADRKSVLLCLGGGVICDIGGFVAACFKRGIEHILFPTTLMAQIDAAIGGKTAINFCNEKNQIGLFAPATRTIILPEFLETLPRQELLSAFAEMLKHGLIADRNYWKQLINININNIEEITNKELILQSIKIKTTICAKDITEDNERKKLNFGHTIGHAIEAYLLQHNASRITHGHCVAIGMIAETFLSQQKRLLSSDKCNIIFQNLLSFFPIFDIRPNDYEKIVANLQFDKKRVGANYNFTLLSDIGVAEINQQVEREDIFKALVFCFETLKERKK